MKHVIMFSGGAGSWATARRVKDTLMTPEDKLVLLFADTLMEDEDLYRFLDQAAANIGVKVTRVAEGRDPWQVFKDKRFLGNTRVDPCSRILKREFLRKWLETHCTPEDTKVYIGISWDEAHRYEGTHRYWQPWLCLAPLIDPPYLTKTDIIKDMQTAGIEPPRLYALGFPHNNCGGFCIKAGQAHFRLLLEKFPERYAYHERKEQELREYLNKDVAILRDRRGGTTKPLTLRELRGRQDYDRFEWGGCGCFSPEIGVSDE